MLKTVFFIRSFQKLWSWKSRKNIFILMKKFCLDQWFQTRVFRKRVDRCVKKCFNQGPYAKILMQQPIITPKALVILNNFSKSYLYEFGSPALTYIMPNQALSAIWSPHIMKICTCYQAKISHWYKLGGKHFNFTWNFHNIMVYFGEKMFVDPFTTLCLESKCNIRFLMSAKHTINFQLGCHIPSAQGDRVAKVSERLKTTGLDKFYISVNRYINDLKTIFWLVY